MTIAYVNNETKLKKLFKNPGYTLIRILGRFVFVRNLSDRILAIKNLKKLESQKNAFGKNKKKSIFKDLDVEKIIGELAQDGISTGINLPNSVVQDLREWCKKNTCYADRLPQKGFDLKDRLAVQEKMGKTILVAQYFNTDLCESVTKLKEDPVLKQIANLYLNCEAKCVGTNIWWTFPVIPTEYDKDQQAHMFHHDVDDIKFLKFFFYLTDVEEGDGPHIFVKKSVSNPPKIKFSDKWMLRRFSDDEIEDFYSANQLITLVGSSGTGFAEDTFGIHKAMTPTRNPRLLLQIQFAVNDFNTMHDRCTPQALTQIV